MFNDGARDRETFGFAIHMIMGMAFFDVMAFLANEKFG